MKKALLFRTAYAAACLLYAGLATPRPGDCQTPDLPVVTARHLFDIRSGFVHPSDVTVGISGRIYVLDGVNNQVKVFDTDGSHLFSFGTAGAGKGSFSHPLGICSTRDGTIYVADSGNSRVQLFDPDGRFKRAFGIEKQGARRRPDPTDVVIDENSNRCYIADNNNHRILVYSRDGARLLHRWGRYGEKPGEFHFPFHLAIDHHAAHANIYAVDVLNARVQAINPDGRTMALIGKWGVDRGQFYRPKGVAADYADRIYVSDSYLGVIQVFQRFREFVGVLGTDRGFMLRFETPTGICIDTALRLYVAEMAANKVSVYQIIE